MIISASYRTDIPALYAPWFKARFEAGFCRVRNPYGGPDAQVPLRGAEVDGYVFWTRNLAPFWGELAAVKAAGLPFIISYTLTGLPKALEPGTIPEDAAIEQMKRAAGLYGPRTVVWRYDPIVFSSLTDWAWHKERFAGLAAALKGVVDESVISFCVPYAKSGRNLGKAAAAFDFEWQDPEPAAKQSLALDLAAIAADHGMRLSLCAQRQLLSVGVADAACVDLKRLSDLAGRPITARGPGHRGRECGCAASRDIGAYDSCTQGCAYCYANASPLAARKGHARHDPAGEYLLP